MSTTEFLILTGELLGLALSVAAASGVAMLCFSKLQRSRK